MMKAVNEATGERVKSWEAERGPNYRCDDCGVRVMYKQGHYVTAHFAHFPGADCVPSSERETERHWNMKLLCLKTFAHLGAEPEVRIGKTRRADVLVGGRFVIECQYSAITAQAWEDRTRDYVQQGYHVLWVWAVERLGFPLVSEAARHYHRSDHQKIPGEIRHCCKYGGRVYFADDHTFGTALLASQDPDGRGRQVIADMIDPGELLPPLNSDDEVRLATIQRAPPRVADW